MSTTNDTAPRAPEGHEKSVFSVELGSLIFQGAESRVHHCTFYGATAVYKHRFPKRYRNPILDERLRVQRTRHEARALKRCLEKGIRAPQLLAMDDANTFLVMTHEAGPTLKEALDNEQARLVAAAAAAEKRSTAPSSAAAAAQSSPSPVTAALLRSMGVVVAKLHNANMVHGDLTTSNFISTFEPQTSSSAASPPPSAAAAASSPPSAALPTAQDIVVLDFGLISDKYSAEERAVDLYVLERALASTHPYLSAFASESVLEGYRSAADPKKGEETLKRLEAVRARGRKRSMVG